MIFKDLLLLLLLYLYTHGFLLVLLLFFVYSLVMYTLAMDCSSRITATICAYKLNNMRYENLFSHAIAIIRLTRLDLVASNEEVFRLILATSCLDRK